MKPWLQECVLKAQYCLLSGEAASIRFIVFFFAHNRGVINRTGYANLSRGSGITSDKFMEVHSVRLLLYCYTMMFLLHLRLLWSRFSVFKHKKRVVLYDRSIYIVFHILCLANILGIHFDKSAI